MSINFNIFFYSRFFFICILESCKELINKHLIFKIRCIILSRHYLIPRFFSVTYGSGKPIITRIGNSVLAIYRFLFISSRFFNFDFCFCCFLLKNDSRSQRSKLTSLQFRNINFDFYTHILIRSSNRSFGCCQSWITSKRS